jgi:hypothetical protein
MRAEVAPVAKVSVYNFIINGYKKDWPSSQSSLFEKKSSLKFIPE